MLAHTPKGPLLLVLPVECAWLRWSWPVRDHRGAEACEALRARPPTDWLRFGLGRPPNAFGLGTPPLPLPTSAHVVDHRLSAGYTSVRLLEIEKSTHPTNYQ